MLRKKRTSPPAVTRPVTPPAPPKVPEAGRVVSVGFEDVSMSWRTRVELAVGSSLTLVAPTRTLGEAIIPEVGRPVVLGWAEEDGYYEGECSFVSAGVDTVVTWVLTVHRVERKQRRSAFRIDTSGAVSLTIGPQVVEGQLRNVSEGGLCCAVRSGASPDEGTRLEVAVELGELGTLECGATVVRTSPSAEPGWTDLGIAFRGIDDHVVEDLRQYVFAEQLERRRAFAAR